MPDGIAPPLPEWALSASIYHIYPFGFLAADTADGTPLERIADWIPHFQAMGVDTLYCGPVAASTRHGYDTIDFYRVDPRLGDLAALKRLIDRLHAAGIRLLLDGVFNHVGRNHPFFQDVLARGRASPYADWFQIDWAGRSAMDDPFDFVSWEGSGRLPFLKLRMPAVRTYLTEVACWWLRETGADGWRLDAAHLLPPDFWAEVSAACRATKPNCLLIGELVEGDYRPFLAGGGLNSATDYHLFGAVQASIKDRSAAPLLKEIQDNRLPGGPYADSRLMSFSGNHDVSRAITRLGSTDAVALALALHGLLPGIPALYYGDELGLAGDYTLAHSNVRQPMPAPDTLIRPAGQYLTPHPARHLIGVIAALTRLRRSHPAFQDGRLVACNSPSPGLLTLVRASERHPQGDGVTRIACAINFSGQAQPLPPHWSHAAPPLFQLGTVGAHQSRLLLGPQSVLCVAVS